jgi:hypothetical protein
VGIFVVLLSLSRSKPDERPDSKRTSTNSRPAGEGELSTRSLQRVFRNDAEIHDVFEGKPKCDEQVQRFVEELSGVSNAKVSESLFFFFLCEL